MKPAAMAGYALIALGVVYLMRAQQAAPVGGVTLPDLSAGAYDWGSPSFGPSSDAVGAVAAPIEPATVSGTTPAPAPEPQHFSGERNAQGLYWNSGWGTWTNRDPFQND